MGRNVAIGIQKFSDIIEKDYFYVDKTAFLRDWWESGDSVTLITRPRRFGKTTKRSVRRACYLEGRRVSNSARHLSCDQPFFCQC